MYYTLFEAANRSTRILMIVLTRKVAKEHVFIVPLGGNNKSNYAVYTATLQNNKIFLTAIAEGRP